MANIAKSDEGQDTKCVGVKKNRCSSCSKQFCYTSTWERHVEKCNKTAMRIDPITNEISCALCNNVYKYKSSFHRHKDGCHDKYMACHATKNPEPETSTFPTFPTFPTFTAPPTAAPPTPKPTQSAIESGNSRAIDELIRSNLQINKLISDVIIPKLDDKVTNTNNGTINNITNINNNKVSINVFLTEHCGNALNLTDFINGIQVNLDDLDYMHANHIESSVKNTLVRALTEIGINQRPIHCTDEKRNTLYVKENGEWEKDTSEHALLKSGISVIRDGHFQQLSEWKKMNDKHMINGTQKDSYLQILNKCTAKIDDSAAKRIISTVAKNTLYTGPPPPIDK